MRSDQAVQIRDLLFDLSSVAQADLKAILRQADSNPDEAIKIIMESYPDTLRGYMGTSELIGTAVLDDYAPGVAPIAVAPLDDDVIRANVMYAYMAQGDTLSILGGSMQRWIFNAYRDSISNSIDFDTRTTTTWARHASPTACGFCRLLATRGAVYTSEKAASQVVGRGKEMTDFEAMWRGDKKGAVQGLGDHKFIAGGVKKRGSRDLGSSYHDHCRCVPVPSTDSNPYVPPSYASDWFSEYEAIAKKASDEGITGEKEKLRYLVSNLEKVGTEAVHAH